MGINLEKQKNKAVQRALDAQGGMIYPGQHLDLAQFLPKKRKRGKISHIVNGQPRTYHQIYHEKNRAGFKRLSVKSYCDMLSLLEQDELV